MAQPSRISEIKIEQPWPALRIFKKHWHWLWRTYYRDLGVQSLGDILRHHWLEARFDKTRDVHTEFRVPSEELDLGSAEIVQNAARYRGTPPYALQVALKRLSERLDGLDDHTIVDYGSGAGRVLLLAAEAGFGRAIGIELSDLLIETNLANIEKHKAKFPNETQFDILKEDATKFVPPADATVFFFFCPFSLEYFDRAMDCIRRSVRANPRPIFVMTYLNPGYRLGGLDLVGEVMAVETYSNILNPEAFLAGGPE